MKATHVVSGELILYDNVNSVFSNLGIDTSSFFSERRHSILRSIGEEIGEAVEFQLEIKISGNRLTLSTNLSRVKDSITIYGVMAHITDELMHILKIVFDKLPQIEELQEPLKIGNVECRRLNP